MPSWLTKARSKTGVVQNTTAAQEESSSSKDPDGENQPQMVKKATTEYQIYRPAVTPGQTELFPVYISVYNLDWTELLPYIREIFPEQSFDDEQMGVEDHYLIYAPRRLSQGENNAIDLIRKTHRERVTHGAGGRRRRMEHSPDGPREPYSY